MSASARKSAPERDAARTAELGVRLRALRQAQGLTLDALAEAAGLDKGYLSRLERGLKNPSIATVLRLSEALEVPVAELFGERLAEHAVRVTRAGDRLAVSTVDKDVSGVEALSRDGAALEAFVLHPAAEFSPDGHSEHAGEELFFVLRGTIELPSARRKVCWYWTVVENFGACGSLLPVTSRQVSMRVSTVHGGSA